MGNVNDELAVLIDRYKRFDAPADDRDVAELVSGLGPYPSIETLEKVVKVFKDRAQAILRTDIPCVLAEYQLSSATMNDGTTVGMDTFFETKQQDKALLADWLEKNGYGAIIKDTMAFEKGEVDDELIAYLEGGKYTFTRDSSVNGMQLKKVVKDHMLAGLPPPPDAAVAVTMFNQAVIKAPKETKRDF